MSGLHQIAGIGGPITIDGVTYQTTTQLTFGMRGEIEAIILKKRPNFMKEVGDSLQYFPKEYHKDMIAEAVRRSAMAAHVTHEEFESYLTTLEGTAYLLWLMIREKQPEIDSLEKALEIAKKISLSELQQELDRAAGLSAIKNSDGPAETTTKTTTGPTEVSEISSESGKSECLGLASTASSPEGATGASTQSTG